ncbi:hypothetical protein Syun_026345 [Stephania yunnanensis]|uniref:Uncharacterized protein n=1 Tax=Stephania yunnanensis TaxID=152371 RepID=A0AAP0HWX9_9MAGN
MPYQREKLIWTNQTLTCGRPRKSTSDFHQSTAATSSRRDTATNHDPPCVDTSSESHTALFLHVSGSIDRPRDAREHTLPDFRASRAILSAPAVRHVTSSHSSSASLTCVSANPEAPCGDEPAHKIESADFRRITRRQISGGDRGGPIRCRHVSKTQKFRESRCAEGYEPEDYVIEISEECEVFQIEPEIVIALNEGEDEMKIDVDSDMSEMLHEIESEEDQLLVLVQLPTLPCTFGKPYKGVEVRERL